MLSLYYDLLRFPPLYMGPRLVSLPVSMPDSGHATVAVKYLHASTLGPGESLNTFRTFLAVHQGDYFRTLA